MSRAILIIFPGALLAFALPVYSQAVTTSLDKAGIGKHELRLIRQELARRPDAASEIPFDGVYYVSKLDRQEWLRSMRTIRESQPPVDSSEALARYQVLSDQTNLKAFKSLVSKGIIDEQLVPSLSVRTNNSASDSPANSERIAANIFSRLTPRTTNPPSIQLGFNNLASIPKVGCGAPCAIVLPGVPDPRPPGQPLSEPPSELLEGLINDKRRTEPFNPVGFLEVARIEYEDDPGSCTGTLISSTVVITAAHCVAGKKEIQIRVLLPVHTEKMIDGCTKDLSNTLQYHACVEFDFLTVSKIHLHPEYDSATWKNDVAYLVLSTRFESMSYASISFETDIPHRITIAGYGDNGTKGKRTLRMLRALEVGWHNGKAVSSLGGKINWLHSNKQSATCRGDSGGPIYNSHYNGGADANKHTIFAIASSGSSNQCINYYVQQTMLGTPTIKQWLCKNLETEISACKHSS